MTVLEAEQTLLSVGIQEKFGGLDIWKEEDHPVSKTSRGQWKGQGGEEGSGWGGRDGTKADKRKLWLKGEDTMDAS